MSERRYSDVEVAAIFERASQVQSGDAHRLTSAAGMTLAQLQDIGREVGIEPSAIAQAARNIGASVDIPSRTLLGLPIAVGRTVQLDHKMSDTEWERLVIDLRETFEARGVVRIEGSFRHWSNGNLQILVEPTPAGDRIRMRTAKGDVRAYLFGGVSMMAMSAFMLTAAALRGGLPDVGAQAAMGALGVMGAVMLGVGTLRLPSWAKRRRQQMEEVANRVTGDPLKP